MLRKIISIKNVGRFRSSAASPNPQLAKHTFILGANGYGKSTLCAILRSLQTGKASHILGRATLGAQDQPAIKILTDSGAVTFDNSAWSQTIPSIAIFDEVFITENVHSGEVVNIEQKRNLYQIIVGSDAIKLAIEESELASKSRAETTASSTVLKALTPHIPKGMEVKEFVGMPKKSDIERLISDQERTVDALKQAEKIHQHPPLSELDVPTLPEHFIDILTTTIDDIARDAEQKVNEHLTAHRMGTSDGEWIAKGLAHTFDTCPFCGQNIESVTLIDAFRDVFSNTFEELVAKIKSMKATISQNLGEAAVARLETRVEQNKNGATFWRQYCNIPDQELIFPENASTTINRLASASITLLVKKTQNPLEPLAVDQEFRTATAAYGEILNRIHAINRAIRSANKLIADKKTTTNADDLKTAEDELTLLKANRTRHTAQVDELCAEYTEHLMTKERIDARKTRIRQQLDTHTEQVVKPYELRINAYLSAFNANFTIGGTKHTYSGGSPTSSYRIVINNIPVDLGDSKTPGSHPSFRNTLSAGDRATLALSFFLAHLESDPAITDKVVVFDDPFNSQDTFRRTQTVHEILRIAKKCRQVLLLSHDATFLKLVWDKTPAAERTSLRIDDQRAAGTKLIPLDLEQACQGRTEKDREDLQNYRNTGLGEPADVIRKLRVILEAHCRTTYPSSFSPDDSLGAMLQKIREGGDEHPAYALYDELDEINAYTARYHHAENIGEVKPDQIDPIELNGFVKRALRVVNALQA